VSTREPHDAEHEPGRPPAGLDPAAQVELLDRAAQRLRHASYAGHYIPAQLRHAAGWLELAAAVHAGAIGCQWCPHGTCPAVDAARGVLGDPRPELLARHGEEIRP
jgi:hypothetical protein